MFALFPPIQVGFPDGPAVKNPPADAGDTGLIPGSGRFLEKEMATHFSILACEIPWTEGPGGLHGVVYGPWGGKRLGYH